MSYFLLSVLEEELHIFIDIPYFIYLDLNQYYFFVFLIFLCFLIIKAI